MIRGVYSVRDGALDWGFFTNSTPSLFYRTKDGNGSYALFHTIRHSFSSGVYGDEPEVIPDESALVHAVASRLHVDRDVLESRIDRSLEKPLGTRACVNVQVCLASKREPRASDVRLLEEAGWGYVEFDPSDAIPEHEVLLYAADPIYAAK